MIVREWFYRRAKSNFHSRANDWGKHILLLDYRCPKCSTALRLEKNWSVPKFFSPQASVSLRCKKKECAFLFPIKNWSKKDWWKKALALPKKEQLDMLFYTEAFLVQLRTVSPSGNLWIPAIEDEVGRMLQEQFSHLPLRINKPVLLQVLQERVENELPLSISGGIIRCLEKINKN